MDTHKRRATMLLMQKKKPTTDRHKNPKLTVRLSPSYQAALKKVAVKNRRPMSEQIKIALEDLFKKEGIDFSDDGD